MKPPPKATMRRRAFAALAAAAAFVFCAGFAAAHPLGNFTINHYARLEVGAERVQIRYVVDMAEISTLQELQKVDADGDGTPSRQSWTLTSRGPPPRTRRDSGSSWTARACL